MTRNRFCFGFVVEVVLGHWRQGSRGLEDTFQGTIRNEHKGRKENVPRASISMQRGDKLSPRFPTRLVQYPVNVLDFLTGIHFKLQVQVRKLTTMRADYQRSF